MLAIWYGDGHFYVNICPAMYIQPWNPRTQLTLVNMPKALLGFAVLCSDRSLNIQQEWGSRSWWSPDMSRAWGTARGHIERFWNVFPFTKFQGRFYKKIIFLILDFLFPFLFCKKKKILWASRGIIIEIKACQKKADFMPLSPKTYGHENYKD
jgi:hypothetical protein